MKRVVIRVETVDTHTDGTTSTSKSEREEAISNSGLLEAWGALMLLLFTFLVFLLTYRIVSTIGVNQNGIRQTEYDQQQSYRNRWR